MKKYTKFSLAEYLKKTGDFKIIAKYNSNKEILVRILNITSNVTCKSIRTPIIGEYCLNDKYLINAFDENGFDGYNSQLYFVEEEDTFSLQYKCFEKSDDFVKETKIRYLHKTWPQIRELVRDITKGAYVPKVDPEDWGHKEYPFDSLVWEKEKNYE